MSAKSTHLCESLKTSLLWKHPCLLNLCTYQAIRGSVSSPWPCSIHAWQASFWTKRWRGKQARLRPWETHCSDPTLGVFMKPHGKKKMGKGPEIYWECGEQRQAPRQARRRAMAVRRTGKLILVLVYQKIKIFRCGSGFWILEYWNTRQYHRNEEKHKVPVTKELIALQGHCFELCSRRFAVTLNYWRWSYTVII